MGPGQLSVRVGVRSAALRRRILWFGGQRHATGALRATTVGGSSSIRVAYVTNAALPHESVPVTVTVAVHVPVVVAVLDTGSRQSSVAVVAASAAAWAAAPVG